MELAERMRIGVGLSYTFSRSRDAHSTTGKVDLPLSAFVIDVSLQMALLCLRRKSCSDIFLIQSTQGQKSRSKGAKQCHKGYASENYQIKTLAVYPKWSL